MFHSCESFLTDLSQPFLTSSLPLLDTLPDGALEVAYSDVRQRAWA